LFKEADFITLHVPAQDGYHWGKRVSNHERRCRIVNCARGGVLVGEIKALDSGKVLFAGLDVLRMSLLRNDYFNEF
jgi:D-3-phosphoglycerate dehydrogenase